MKTFLVFLVNAVLVLSFRGNAFHATADAISPEESGRIVGLIIDKYSTIYRQYQGVESTSNNIIQEFDPATNELKSTAEVTLLRKDYYHASPEIKVVSLKKDGKDVDPKKYRSRETKPSHLLFDEKSGEQYIYRISEKKKINDRECYRIEVAPRKETSKHFKGDVFCAVDTLDIMYLVGGVAKLDFPLKDFWMEFNYVMLNGISVVQSGTVKVRAKVPGFYPDTLIVTTMSIVESKLIEQQK
jgi:hypothetical protein